MNSGLFLRLALPTPLRRFFDYLPLQDVDCKALTPGIRVKVPFQSRVLIGVLTEVVKEASIDEKRLKTAIEILDEKPLFPKDLYQLCLWAADYYHYSLGEVLASALPTLLRKGKFPKPKAKSTVPSQEETPPLLNAAQQTAVSAIIAAQNSFRIFLLDGVTGSGKTEVYLRAIDQMIKEGKQVLVLVPEISLTPQTIARFRARFPVAIAALHSSLSERERALAWLSARDGKAKIVIGTRSAVFTPFAHLGLIIVDEEHDTSFKQQDRFRYHARDLAIKRASLNRIPIVLGTATPSLESLLNVRRNRYDYLSLPQRAGLAILPRYQLLDLRYLKVEAGLSNTLMQAMQEHLAQNNQVLLFLNRRGFAPVLYCVQCGFIIGCKRCAARMVYHRTPLRLQCHHCDAQKPVPTQCPQCAEKTLQPIGLGTQRLEQMLQENFPDVPIIRIDRDNTRRKDSLPQLLEQINQQQKSILLGTQMLAKGHHFRNVTLVGIVDADSGLFSADFRAAEQMGQTLLQVAGRAGRAEKPGTVLIQTRNPEHPLLQTLIHQGYHAFAETLLSERESTSLPPFSYFALFRAESYGEESASQFLTKLKDVAQSSLTGSAIHIYGPLSAILSKRKGLHCQHLLIKANQRSVLQSFLKTLLAKLEESPRSQPVKWTLDVDPVGVL